ncbi:MAG: competence protein ComEC [Micavibrio sp.]|nr:MAG: competence protein ComEC [Micavibrio sp.]
MTAIVKKSAEFVLPPVFRRMKEAFYAECALQQDHLFLWSPVFMAIGIGFYFSLGTEPPLALGLVCVAISVGLLFFLWPERQNRKALWLGVMAVFLMSTGFSAATIRTSIVHTPMLVKKLGPVDIVGTVHSIEDMGEGQGSRIMLSHLEVERLEPDQTPRYVRLRLRKDEGVLPGQRVKVLGLLNPPSPPVAPGAFDFQRYSYFLGIGAVGFIYYQPEVIEDEGQNFGAAAMERTRQKIVTRLQKHLDNPKSSAVAQALIVGKRKAITEEDQEAFRGSGLAHMLAISGLHVGLASGVIFFFVRLLMASFPGFALRHPIKKYAAVVAFCGAATYMMLVGMPVTTQRAVLMIGVVFLAIIMDRWPFSLRLVAFAALVVLLFAPESLTGAGFHMSFAAVACLIAFYERMRPHLSLWYRGANWQRKLALYFLGVCMTSIIAGLATAPFAMFHFQRFELYGLLGNLVAVPIMAFLIMPFAVLSLLLMPLGLESLPLAVMDWGITGVLEIAHYVSSLPGATLHITAWPPVALLFVVFSGLVLILWRGRLKIVAVPLFMISVLLILLYKQPDILVSSSNKLYAFSEKKGTLYASARNKDRFVLETWERMLAVPEGEARRWPSEGKFKEGKGPQGLMCGELGCYLEMKGAKIAFSHHPLSYPEDCTWADVLISSDPVKDRECNADIIIDKFDTWRDGSHAIWLGQKGITVKNADELRGNRPWVAD